MPLLLHLQQAYPNLDVQQIVLAWEFDLAQQAELGADYVAEEEVVFDPIQDVPLKFPEGPVQEIHDKGECIIETTQPDAGVTIEEEEEEQEYTFLPTTR